MSTRIARGFAWNHLYKFSEYGLTTLYSVLILRAVGPELAGSYAVYLSIGAALAVIGSVGVDGALLRYVPRIANGERLYGESEYEGVRHFLTQLLAFRLVVTAVLVALVILALSVVPAYWPAYSTALGSLRSLTPFVVIYLIGQALTAFSTFALISLLKTKSVFIASLISRTSIVIAGGILVLGHYVTIRWAVGLHAVTALVNGLLLLYTVYRRIEHERQRGPFQEATNVIGHALKFVRSPRFARSFMLLPFMVYGVTTWGNDILSTVLGRQPDILMLRAMLGENARDIGLYHCASMIVVMTEYVFLFGLGHTLVSVFSELAQDDEKQTNRTSYPRLLKARQDIAGFQSVTTAPLFGFMIAFAPLVLQVIYGPKYAGAEKLIVVALAILSFSVIVFGGGMHITSLVAIGKERWVFRNRLKWGLVNLALNFFLIRQWGGLGAIIGTQICNTAACVNESWYANRVIGGSMSLQRVAPVILVAIVSVGVSYWINQAFLTAAAPLLQLLCAGLVTAILTLLAYWLLRLPDALRVLQKARHILPDKKPSANLQI